MFTLMIIGFLVLSLAVACGSDDSEDDEGGADGDAVTATTGTGTGSGSGSATGTTGGAGDDADATGTTGSDADSGTSTTGGGADSSTSTTGGGAATGDLGEVGTCFQEGTTPELIAELREGETESAEEMYQGCLEGVLPEAMVDQMEPIIEEAAECGAVSAEALTEDEVAQLESGDAELTERIANETLACVSEELGIDLS